MYSVVLPAGSRLEWVMRPRIEGMSRQCVKESDPQFAPERNKGKEDVLNAGLSLEP